MLIPVRRDSDAILKLVLKPSEKDGAITFDFNQDNAKAFKDIVSSRELGSPVIYHGKLRLLDHGHNQNWNLRGKFINSANDKDIVIHIQSKDDFDALVPYLNQTPLTIIACPIIEYSSFDPVAGDIQFLKIVENV
jgi:hypothetical protein